MEQRIMESTWVLALASAALAISALTSGCASVELERTGDDLAVKYSSFMKKLEAPAVTVDRPGEYSASFNAETTGTDPMAAAMIQMSERLLCVAVPGACVVPE